MPNGLWYASGPCRTIQAIPASAYSKGDLVIFDSNSSFSRQPPDFASGVDTAGIALGDSVDTIRDLNTALVPAADTHLWASLATNLTSHVTAGEEGNFAFAVANNRYYFVPSASSVRAVCVRGTTDIDQSVQSRVIVRMITHAGNFEL